MDLTANDFEGTILKNKQSLAVVFTASWCPFCRMFLPVFESSLSEKKLPYATVDLASYDNPLWETFEIEVVPSVVIFKSGQVVYRADGKYGRGLANNVMDDVIRELSIPQS